MSYTLQAIVATRETLGAADSEVATIDITDALKMLPLTSEVRERCDIPFLPLLDEGSEALPQSLASLCQKLSRHGLVAYLEAQFWGGLGEQAHVLFKDGLSLGPPVIAEDAINQALRRLAFSPAAIMMNSPPWVWGAIAIRISGETVAKQQWSPGGCGIPGRLRFRLAASKMKRQAAKRD